jgi:phage protein D
VTAYFKADRPEIRLAGEANDSLRQGMIGLKIHEDHLGLSSCELTVGNWGTAGTGLGYLYFGRDKLEFGKDIAVFIDGSALFSGRITGLEGQFPRGAPPRITVLAEDRLQDLRMTRRTRSFADVTDAGAIEQIAGDHGLTPDVDVQGPVHRVLAQLNQSDLAFVRDRARAVDAEVWVDERTLSVKRHAARDGGRLRLVHGSKLVEFTVLADLAGQRSSVTVTGWDVSSKQELKEQADDSSLGAELGDLVSGASVLRNALAERKEMVTTTVPGVSREARVRAEALFRQTARRFVRGHGTAETQAGLRVGATVQLDGLGPLFSGDYYITEATHRYDEEDGLRTDFTVERPGLGRAA